MSINRRKFLSLTTVSLASSVLSCAAWSNGGAGALAPAKATVDSKKSFISAIKNAKAGDIIVIKNGTYPDWSAVVDCHGAKQQPVVIRPESAGGVIFTELSHLSITGRYVTITGFRFNKCKMKQNLLEFNRSEHCQISHCDFKNSGHDGGAKAAIGIVPGSTNNLVLGCVFDNITARNINLTMNKDIHKHGVPIGNVIRQNHFKNIPRFGENGRETVKIGTKQPIYGNVHVGTLVEDNLFERCNGEREIISNKCGGNTYRRNVFSHCEGELVMRGGEKCLIEGNKFFSCHGGMRICGKGHVIKENLIVNSKNTGIRLYTGMTLTQGGHYQAPTECLITNNTIVNAGNVGIFIGAGRGGDHGEKGIQTVAPQNNRIVNNIVTGKQGDLCKIDNAPNNMVSGNLYFAQRDTIVSYPGKEPMYADPQFIAPEQGNFKLKATSPARKFDPIKGALHA